MRFIALQYNANVSKLWLELCKRPEFSRQKNFESTFSCLDGSSEYYSICEEFFRDLQKLCHIKENSLLICKSRQRLSAF